MESFAIAPSAVISPLIARHAEDAAFYWSLLDSAENSVQLGLARYTHFNQLLKAHLEGLQVAGPEGQYAALAALKRWKGAAETFIVTWLLAQTHDTAAMTEHFAQLSKHADTLLRGVISALAWAPRSNALRWLRRLAAEGASEVAQVAALRTAALIGHKAADDLPLPLTQYLASPHAFVRAAACRAACSGIIDSHLLTAIRTVLGDVDMAVRAEAAIALARCGAPESAASVLWQCVAAQADAYSQKSGWYRQQAARRLLRWVRYLAAITPLGHADIPQLLRWLPSRISLTFVLHHGDCAYLLYVIECMRDSNEMRFAGWVWQTLTGLDLTANGWVLPEPDVDDESDAITEARLDADQGLPLPDVAAIQAAQAALGNKLPVGVRCLLGQELTPLHAVTLLESAPQALRGIAAQALMQAFPGKQISVRGPASTQLHQLAELSAQVLA